MAGKMPQSGQEVPRTPNEATEMGKQFAVHADTITAFATVQLVGFMLLMTHGDCFTRNVLSGLCDAVAIGGVVNLA